MKVFISWSGERSQALAKSLYEWMPLVIHYVEPWLSEADVAAGERWGQAVAAELEASNFGVICVTPENVGSPWVLFEAGALAKSMKGAKVVPLLYNLDFSDITGPLAQFQAKKFEKQGLSEVIESINQATDGGIPEVRVEQLFDALWPEFEKQLGEIPKEAPTAKHMRPQDEILEELVAGVRGLDSRFRDLESVVVAGLRSPRRRYRRMQPRLWRELAHTVSDGPDDAAVLLVLAGVVRDDLPWAYEVLVEAYRKIQDGDQTERLEAVRRLHRLTDMVGRGSVMEELGLGSKEAHMMMMDMPMMLEDFLHRYERSSLGSEELLQGEFAAADEHD